MTASTHYGQCLSSAQQAQCQRCIMDASAADISFDSQGFCNFCTEFLARLERFQPSDEKELDRRLNALVSRVKADGKGERYDCIVGLSGGIDSTYTLYLAKEHGLRPLAVHMDNGWNSELAVHNIANIVRKLDIDLATHVIDWGEYKRLMQALFDADVLDVELLYDNAMLAVNYRFAREHGVRWILGGTNIATEGMRMPTDWNWFKYDKRNIRALGRRSGVAFDTFPAIGTVDFILYRYVLQIKWTSFLDYVRYSKSLATASLADKFDYRAYPYKHYESIFTRFYQGYILPVKFGIDKRKLHLSTLIVSGQMRRDEAVEMMKRPPYPSEASLQEDISYFLKKMSWQPEQLPEYLARPRVPHARYGTEEPLWNGLEKLARRTGLLKRTAG